MANIYSYATESWNYENVMRVSSNSFRFGGIGANATTIITSEEIGELGGELFFRGFVTPSQYNLTQGLRCRLDIYTKQDADQQYFEVEKHFVFIKGDRNGAINQKIITYGGSFNHIDLKLEVLVDGQLSVGNTIELTSFIIGNASSSSTANIEEEINAALPFLVYDTNKQGQTNNMTDNEIYVGMIPINMKRDNVDTDAGFRTNITVDNDGVLTERFYRDGIEELLSPIITDLKAGRHLISDDHAYFNVSKGSHTYLATLQFEGGNMEIDTRKTLYTIETSRAGMRDISIEGNILDMAFSGVENKLMPDEVWLMVQDIDSEVIHIQHGIYYPETQTIGFQNDIEYLEEVIGGSIEFDGYWEKSTLENNKKKFISSGKPKVLLLREDGSLTYGDYDKPDTNTLMIQSDGVMDCSLILGWNFKSNTESVNDMGMIVAYIKEDGNAYYRTILNSTMDIEPFALPYNGATYPLKEIRTFRTNDYRVGFTVTDNNNNLHTILTDRYLQGDSVESVYLESKISQSNVNFLAVENPVTTKMLYAINPDNNNEIQVHLNEPLLQETDKDGNLIPITGFTLKDGAGIEYAITFVELKEECPATAHLVLERDENRPVIQDELVIIPDGVTTMTSPMTIAITSTNLKGKKTVHSLRNEQLSELIPNDSMISNDIIDHIGSPLVIPRYNRIKASFSESNITFSPTAHDITVAVRYGDYNRQHFLDGTFSDDNIIYAPIKTEPLLREPKDNHYIDCPFSQDNIVFIVQAYTINNIPL